MRAELFAIQDDQRGELFYAVTDKACKDDFPEVVALRRHLDTPLEGIVLPNSGDIIIHEHTRFTVIDA